MSFLLKKNIHLSLAEIFYNDLLARRSTYYYFIGKIVDWENPSSPDEPMDTGEYEYFTRNGIIGVKKIQTQDVSFVIPRRNWTSGIIYDQYDSNYSEDFPAPSGATSLKDASFYVLSTFQGMYYNVYKCLSNNNESISTERPTGSDPVAITYDDGYIWKYMYTIPLSSRNKFLTGDYIPVSRAISNQYYSNGSINSVIIDNRGTGYSNTSQVTLSVACEFLGSTGNVNATVKPILNSTGQFLDAVVINKGNNIKSANVVINDTFGSGTSYYKQANSIIITDNGAGYTAAAIANTSININTSGAFQPDTTAICALTFVGTEVGDIEIINGGSGYTQDVVSNTVVAITTTGLTQPTTNATATINFSNSAILKPLIVNNKIEDIFILDPGIGYSANLQTFVSLIGDGQGARLTPYVANGQVEDIIIENAGSGYTYLDIDIIGDGSNANAYVDFSVGDLDTLQSTVELSAVDGAVYAIKMLDSGDGYTNANVTLKGDGLDFVGNCIIQNNTITKIEVINPGRGYTHANVIITGTGSNASASAIISPAGGHGYDPITELFADTIIIYSTINNEKNQGIEVNNDYRQFGLLRNITKFGVSDNYVESLGSACYLANLSTKIGLVNDTRLQLISDNTISFHVVTLDNNTNRALLSNDNNYDLNEGVTLINPLTNDTYTIKNIISEPNINKFSGDLLFIDNRTTITYSDNQLVTLKTVLKL